MIAAIAIAGLFIVGIICFILGFRLGVLMATARAFSKYTLNHEPSAEEIVRMMHSLMNMP